MAQLVPSSLGHPSSQSFAPGRQVQPRGKGLGKSSGQGEVGAHPCPRASGHRRSRGPTRNRRQHLRSGGARAARSVAEAPLVVGEHKFRSELSCLDGKMRAVWGSRGRLSQDHLQVKDVVDDALQDFHLAKLSASRDSGYQLPQTRVAVVHVVEQAQRLLSCGALATASRYGQAAFR